MTTSTLQEILQHVPMEMVDQMNELCPGVPANKKNLSTLLQYIKNNGMLLLDQGEDGLRVEFEIYKNRKKHFTLVRVEGPKQQWRCGPNLEHTLRTRPALAFQKVECTEDGLLEGIVFVKNVIKRYREDGICSECENKDGEQPRKRLKCEGMSGCESCIIRKAINF